MLDAAKLTNIARKNAGWRVLTLEECASTNDVAVELLATDGEAHGTVVFAEHQTAGRGRRGHVWHSRAGLGLLFSVALKASPSPPAPALVAAAAAAIRNASLQITGAAARIKWPNDLYIYQKKFAGILVEARLAGESANIVIGAGVNLNHDPNIDFAPEIRNIATSLKHESNVDVDRYPFANCVLDFLDLYLSEILIGKYDQIEKEFMNGLGLANQQIEVELLSGGRVQGSLVSFDCIRGVEIAGPAGSSWIRAELIAHIY
ncbi:MAG: biotin--[acetyl-CoA-carboxylase] ligase [Planctomycetota bacterium]